MKNPLFKKLRGYQKAPRQRFEALANGLLTHEELIMYEFGVAITDWDKNHETYGTFLATNQQLAEVLGWKSDTSAMRVRRTLIRKGRFIEVEEGRIKPKGFEKWQLRRTSSEKENPAAKTEIKTAIFEQETAKKEEFLTQQDNYSLVSFKGDLGLSKEIPDESLPDEELDKILADIDSTKISSLTAPQKSLDQMTSTEQLTHGIEVFGLGTRWEKS